MRGRKVIVTSRITTVAPLMRGKPDNGKAVNMGAGRIPKKESAAASKKRKKLEKLEKILFGRNLDKNIQIFPEHEGMRRRLTPLEKDLFCDRRRIGRKRGMKKRHQMRRRLLNSRYRAVKSAARIQRNSLLACCWFSAL